MITAYMYNTLLSRGVDYFEIAMENKGLGPSHLPYAPEMALRCVMASSATPQIIRSLTKG